MSWYAEDGYDCGFDLPDTRVRFISKDGKEVNIVIVRNWFTDEDGETDWYPTFTIKCDRFVTHLPKGVDEWKAEEIALLMYGIDEQETIYLHEQDAEMRWEREAGC